MEVVEVGRGPGHFPRASASPQASPCLHRKKSGRCKPFSNACGIPRQTASCRRQHGERLLAMRGERKRRRADRRTLHEQKPS